MPPGRADPQRPCQDGPTAEIDQAVQDGLGGHPEQVQLATMTRRGGQSRAERVELVVETSLRDLALTDKQPTMTHR